MQIVYLEKHVSESLIKSISPFIMCFNSRERGQARWNTRIAQQNLRSVEAGAIHGRENTSPVNEKHILSG